MINKFLDRIKQAKMDTLTNFIIMSDHGMTYGAQPNLEQHDFPTFPHDRTSVQKVYLEHALRLTFIVLYPLKQTQSLLFIPFHTQFRIIFPF